MKIVFGVNIMIEFELGKDGEIFSAYTEYSAFILKKLLNNIKVRVNFQLEMSG